MMKIEDVSEWRAAAVLWCLRKGPQTAAEVADYFAAVCQADGVPVALWRMADPSSMAGNLRKLEGAGRVVRDGGKSDPRAGRVAPLWKLVDKRSVSTTFPAPPDVLALERARGEVGVIQGKPKPEAKAEEVAQPVTFFAEISDDVLNSGFDELAGIVARHQKEIAAFVMRMRARCNLDGVAG